MDSDSDSDYVPSLGSSTESNSENSSTDATVHWGAVASGAQGCEAPEGPSAKSPGVEDNARYFLKTRNLEFVVSSYISRIEVA